jgi:hypothetical protein
MHAGVKMAVYAKDAVNQAQLLSRGVRSLSLRGSKATEAISAGQKGDCFDPSGLAMTAWVVTIKQGNGVVRKGCCKSSKETVLYAKDSVNQARKRCCTQRMLQINQGNGVVRKGCCKSSKETVL